MENNPITAMYNEHEIIKQAEEVIKNLNQVWETDSEKYVDTATKLVDFFKEYADGYHHRKEEDVLFPAIKDHPDFVLQEIIEEFEEHHEGFREYAAEIREAIADEDYTLSYKTLTRYIDELLDHIAAENEELFVLAENLMDETQLETIYFKFMDIDMELGEARKKEYENKIKQLL